MKEEIKQLRETQNPEEPRRKKKEDSETDTKAPTETSFTMVPGPVKVPADVQGQQTTVF